MTDDVARICIRAVLKEQRQKRARLRKAIKWLLIIVTVLFLVGIYLGVFYSEGSPCISFANSTVNMNLSPGVGRLDVGKGNSTQRREAKPKVDGKNRRQMV